MSKKKIASPKSWGYNRDFSSPTDTWCGDVKKNAKNKHLPNPVKIAKYGCSSHYLNEGFHKWGYPFIIHFNRIFPYKSSSYWGAPIYGNHHLRYLLIHSQLGKSQEKTHMTIQQ